MNPDNWTAVDSYFAEAFSPADPVMEATRAANAKAGLPAIDVSPAQGKFLQMIAAIQGARRILEIGTLGGYSTIWLARALQSGGLIVTLEADPKHAEVAKANIDRAGFGGVVRIIVGRALETLPEVATRYKKPFDLVFIDADKVNSAAYFRWAIELSRAGTVIIIDNVVRGGAVVDADSTDPSVTGARNVVKAIASEPRVTATAMQTVGLKGHDGFIMARVL